MGKHENVTCDVCGTKGIVGMRHKCHLCYNYDLCDRCYQQRFESKHHKATHPMEDIPPGQSAGATKPQRDSPVGKYVRRGRDWKWEDQDSDGRGTCVALENQWVSVRWENGTKNRYRWGIENAYDVFIEGIAEAKDLVGCVVRRGPDWKWGDQDENGEGIIEGQPTEGIALVRWIKSGTAMQYRWGMENAYDILIVSDKDPRKQSQSQQPQPQQQQGGGSRTITLRAGGRQQQSQQPQQQQQSQQQQSSSGGDDDEPVELDDDAAVKLIWLCSMVLMSKMKAEAYKVLPDRTQPETMVQAYNFVYRVEQSIKFPYFTQAWRSHKFDYWKKEMASNTVSLPHLASCLIELEMNILSSSQDPDWGDIRQKWVTLLVIVGGRPFKYPTPRGPSSYDQSTGGKVSQGRGGTRSDLDDIMNGCKMQ